MAAEYPFYDIKIMKTSCENTGKSATNKTNACVTPNSGYMMWTLYSRHAMPAIHRLAVQKR